MQPSSELNQQNIYHICMTNCIAHFCRHYFSLRRALDIFWNWTLQFHINHYNIVMQLGSNGYSHTRWSISTKVKPKDVRSSSEGTLWLLVRNVHQVCSIFHRKKFLKCDNFSCLLQMFTPNWSNKSLLKILKNVKKLKKSLLKRKSWKWKNSSHSSSSAMN